MSIFRYALKIRIEDVWSLVKTFLVYLSPGKQEYRQKDRFDLVRSSTFYYCVPSKRKEKNLGPLIVSRNMCVCVCFYHTNNLINCL